MRNWLVVAALMILPIVVYWPTVTHEYGFRDDYSNLREVRERPGWLMTLTSSSGRPVYGVLLEGSLSQIYQVTELAKLRALSAVLAGVVGVLLWWQLRRSGWSDMQSAAMGAAVILLPGIQVVVGWAIAWPIMLALILALLAFSLIERGMHTVGRMGSVSVAAGAALYFIVGLTYQTSALFAIMPFTAALLLRPETSARDDSRWITVHVGTLFAALFAGFLVMNIFFTEGVVPEMARMHIEPHPFIKLLWFARNPLPNSVALFALRDTYATPVSFWLVVGAVTAIIVLGFFYGAKTAQQRARWLFAALLLPFLAHSVSLAASSQAIGYRTLLPLAGLYLVLAMFGWRAIVARFALPRLTQGVALACVVVVGAVLARYNALTLIAEPQGNEWKLIEAAAKRMPLASETRVYLIRPSVEYRSTERMYADEFGSLTSDVDWAAKEMFKAALRERFPDGLPAGTDYLLTTGFGPPPPVGYDVVADLRDLKNMGERAPPETTASQR
jgi:predicted membrane protein